MEMGGIILTLDVLGGRKLWMKYDLRVCHVKMFEPFQSTMHSCLMAEKIED